MKVAALYVAKGGAYWDLPDVDPWDAERDARLYAGPWPVVAHPVCGPWSKLAPINAKRYGHRIGDDGQCFEKALASVRRWGGVLEHPAESRAWTHFNLLRPRAGGGWSTGLFDPGWVCEIAQSTYGHRAQKRTWLYAVTRTAPPELNWEWAPPTAQVSFLSNHRPTGLPMLTKREAQATPLPFRDLLLSIARLARAGCGESRDTGTNEEE